MTQLGEKDYTLVLFILIYIIFILILILLVFGSLPRAGFLMLQNVGQYVLLLIRILLALAWNLVD